MEDESCVTKSVLYNTQQLVATQGDGAMVERSDSCVLY